MHKCILALICLQSKANNMIQLTERSKPGSVLQAGNTVNTVNVENAVNAGNAVNKVNAVDAVNAVTAFNLTPTPKNPKSARKKPNQN